MGLESVFKCDFCRTVEQKPRAMLPTGWVKINATLTEAGMEKVPTSAFPEREVVKYTDDVTLLYLCPDCKGVPLANLRAVFKEILESKK